MHELFFLIKYSQTEILFMLFHFISFHLQLDTVCRVLLDRKWTVGELAAATLDYAKDILEYDDKTSDATIETSERCLFEKLIGI